MVTVRKAALDVLATVRDLHGALLAAGGRSNPPTAAPASSLPTPGVYATHCAAQLAVTLAVVCRCDALQQAASCFG